MRVNGREWPPEPLQPTTKPQRQQSLEAGLLVLLIAGSPMLAWLLSWLDVGWARVVWPIGWLSALTLIVVSVCTRKGLK